MTCYYSGCIDFHIMIHISVLTKKYIAVIQCGLLFYNVSQLDFFQLALHWDHQFKLFILLLGVIQLLCTIVLILPGTHSRWGKLPECPAEDFYVWKNQYFQPVWLETENQKGKKNPILLLNLAVFVLCTGIKHYVMHLKGFSLLA